MCCACFIFFEGAFEHIVCRLNGLMYAYVHKYGCIFIGMYGLYNVCVKKDIMTHGTNPQQNDVCVCVCVCVCACVPMNVCVCVN
jgi:hypothetical protein